MLWKLLPNLLTLLRLVAGVALPLTDPFWWLPLVIFAGVSDLIDGWLCRKWHGSTSFGQIVDPIADKTFVVAALYGVWSQNWLTVSGIVWLAIRDITVVILTIIAAASTRLTTRDLKPRWSGKFATAAQFIALAVIIYQQSDSPYVVLWCGGVSLIAALDYIYVAWRVFHRRPVKRP